jgi:hypothetical protein
LASQLAQSTQSGAQLRREAAELRQFARYGAEKTQEEAKTTNAEIKLVWRAVDTSTTAVLASGSASATSSITSEASRVESSSYTREESTSKRYESLINEVVSNAVEKLTPDVAAKVEKQPFRAKIAKVDRTGVILNCGSNLGLATGDTFAVRQKRELVTDPDTGLPLDSPGETIALIRVTEVFEKTAFAQVIERSAPLKRGDEVEWIGVYNAVEPNK